MATPRGGNNGSNGAAEEGGQTDGNNNLADDGSDDDIILEGPTMTDLLPIQQPQNGERLGVHEEGSSNGRSFAGLSDHRSTPINEDLHNGLSGNNLAATNLEPPHIPLNNWLQSPVAPVTDLLRLLGLREQRARPQRRATRKNHKHKPQKRK
ncbi:hypothetical protein V502_05191 [Pseudogymnoascus sp. VKM F-4520 (FW-2644)]|nr:hypothetical protein V502_05191 [Pseudogymnoascus sp. VKM F-4520 (FW-2644)]